MNVQKTLSSARVAAAVAALAIGLTIAGCKSSPNLSDAAISTALQNKLAADSAISAEPIQATVQNGIATLNGTVSTEAARSLAANDAAQVQGIKTVVNNLTVQQASAPPIAPPVAPGPVQPDKPVPTPVKEKPLKKIKPQPEIAQNNVPPPPAPIERPAPIEQAPPPPPPPPPQPTFRDVTIPAGTTLPIRITQTLDSATTQQGDTFTGTVATDVIIDGLVAIPQGATVSGRVDQVQEAAHFKGNSLLVVELTNLNRRGEHIPIVTDSFSKAGNGRGKNTAEKVGGGAAVGAILGGILGGGKGAAIGAAAGGGVGAGANAVTRGQQVQIPSETLIRFKLTNSIVVRASLSRDPNSTTDPNLQRRPANQ